MQRRWIPAAVLAASAFALGPALAMGPTAVAGAGQPNQSCQTVVAGGGTEPGHAATSPGSPFNEVSGKGGAAYTAGNAHSPNTTNAVSQYDVACAQVTADSN